MKGYFMNTKRLIYSSIAVFAFVFAFEWGFHNVLLEDMYIATAHLWRTPVEMQQYMFWMILGQLLASVMFCFIFAKGYEGKGLGEGFRYGFYISLLLNAPNLIMYAVTPYPAKLIGAWVGGTTVECILAGILLAAIYRKA